ncbi:MAG: HEAT repeat domain-containing protein [Verrucomicrobiales bacterium]|nr:HEAT repeat domain-containing protein [Verrucomicrobiales bacterium]
MRSIPAVPTLLMAAALLAAVGYQQHRIGLLVSQMAEVQRELGNKAGDAAPAEAPAPESPLETGNHSGDLKEAPLIRRLGALEQAVARLTDANDHLMNRGQLPLTTEKREQLLAQLENPSAEDRERLQALRLLRRNGSIPDEALQAALDWLGNTTNGSVRVRLLQQLTGLTNAHLQPPLLALASSGSEAEVRQKAIGALRPFVGDPQVDSQLWNLFLQESDPGVRRQAREALLEGPVSDARATLLRDRASGTGNSVEERTLAWEALRSAGKSTPEVTAALAQLAQVTTDTKDRLRIFEVFNEASDPAFIPPLVQGLQDPSPLIRARAADALSDFRSEPAVEEWFRYLAENDSDSNVRRQAMRALNDRAATQPNRPAGRPRGRP